MTAPEGSVMVPSTVPPTTCARSRAPKLKLRIDASMSMALGEVPFRFAFIGASESVESLLFDRVAGRAIPIGRSRY
jgi:hypothetical protein